MSIKFDNGMSTEDITKELNNKLFFNSEDDELELETLLTAEVQDNFTNSVITKNFIINDTSFPYNNIIMIDINDLELLKNEMSLHDFINTNCYSGFLSNQDDYYIDCFGLFLVSGGSSGGMALVNDQYFLTEKVQRSGESKYYQYIYTTDRIKTSIKDIKIKDVIIGSGGVYDENNNCIGKGGETKIKIFENDITTEYIASNTYDSAVVRSPIGEVECSRTSFSWENYLNNLNQIAWIKGATSKNIPLKRKMTTSFLAQYYIPHSGEHVCGLGPQGLYYWFDSYDENADYLGLDYFLCNTNEGIRLKDGITIPDYSIISKDFADQYFIAKPPTSYGSSGVGMGKGSPTNGAPGLICIYF